MAECEHLNTIKVTSTDTHVCEECVKMGDTWVQNVESGYITKMEHWKLTT